VVWRDETVVVGVSGCGWARDRRDAAEAGKKAGPIIGGMMEQGTARSKIRKAGGKRRYWAWLLVVPLVLLVYPGMYARMTPELFGFPFFYWYQFAVVIATALLTGAVYWLGRFHE
jgi:hypothetical protein